MNPRRAPGPRPPLDAAALRRRLETLRAAYEATTPGEAFVRRVTDAVEAAGLPPAVRRRRRRVVLAAVVSGLATAASGLAVLCSAVVGRPSGPPAPASSVAACAGAASASSVGTPTGARSARLRALLASARRLEQPDGPTRAGWVLATFDPDPQVRAAARALLCIADRLAGVAPVVAREDAPLVTPCGADAAARAR